MKNGRYFCLLAAGFAAAFALGQGSAAGYGQKNASQYGQGGQNRFFGGGGGGAFGGGGFGGGQGGQGMQRASAENRAKPDYDDTPGLWTTRHAVLTPGDRVEYKFKMKAGETIFGGASSDAFDPALEFDDSKGTKLAANDDRVEGDQEPFLIYRCAKDGDYVLKVLSYRSVSGGAFDVRFRTFQATDAGFGPVAYTDLYPIHLENGGDHYEFRINAHKGKYYDLSFLDNGNIQQRISGQFDRIVGPTGVEDSDFQVIASPDGSMVFMAKADGDYYIEYFLYERPVKKIGTEFRELSPSVITQASSQDYQLAPYSLQIVQFPVKPNMVVRTTIKGDAIATMMSGPPTESDQQNFPSGDGFGTNAQWTWFKMNVDTDNDDVRVFHGTGTTIIAIRSVLDRAQTVTVHNEDQLPDWKEGAATAGSLDIGDARLYTLHSSHSELMEVAAEADHFQIKMEIFRFDGEIANTLMQRRSKKVGDNLYFPDADTFLVRISCDGNGGSGAYSMKRDTYSPTPYAMGQTKSLTLHGDDFGLYSMNLEKGKRYELITDQYIGTDVIDENGDFLTTQPVNLGSVIVQYFVPTKSGVHRLWLRGQPGTYKFRLEPTVPPSLGT